MIDLKNQILIAATRYKAARQEKNETEKKVWSSIWNSLNRLQEIDKEHKLPPNKNTEG